METRTGHGSPDSLVAERAEQLGPLSILLVEDDPSLRRALELLLGHMGHLVISASGAKQVAGMLRGFEVDLVISDHRLPDGTSHDVMTAVRQASATLPAILMSGYATDTLEAIALAEGFSEILAKPIDPGLLQRAAWKAMGRPF